MKPEEIITFLKTLPIGRQIKCIREICLTNGNIIIDGSFMSAEYTNYEIRLKFMHSDKSYMRIIISSSGDNLSIYKTRYITNSLSEIVDGGVRIKPNALKVLIRRYKIENMLA